MTTRWLIAAITLAAASGACLRQPSRSELLPHQKAGNGAAVEDSADIEATPTPATISPPVIPANVGATLKGAADAHADLCSNDGAHPSFPDDADRITRTFCQDMKPGGVMPTPTGIDGLLEQLGLDFKDANGGNGVGGNPAFALLGHSSALTARKVSPITPTAFIFTPPPADGSAPSDYTILAFDPGEQFVEVASYDPTAKSVNFYIVFFDQPCTHLAGGCSNAQLLTSKLLSGWSNVRVYEDTTELGNTILDCHVCHQPDNDADPFLRMQEITPPFTHWFSAETAGGRALFSEFHSVHGNESYGGIPATLVDKSDPAKLAALIRQAGFGQQPNAFDSQRIEAEMKAAGKSPTWEGIYERAVGGAFIAAPYHDVDITDPKKVDAARIAWQNLASGKTDTLPDIRDVFLDRGLRDMGFAPKMGLDGRGLLVQMCQECHHSKLDPTLSREKFLVDRLDQMSRAEKDLAIERLKTTIDDRLAMPPALFRTITADERDAMIQALAR